MTTVPRWVEEAFPFLKYLEVASKIRSEIEDALSNRATSPRVRRDREAFSGLSLRELEVCLEREHARADALAEKTFKFGALLASALVIASTAIALIADDFRESIWKMMILVTALPAFICVAIAGMLGLSANRVQRRYGLGAEVLVMRKGKTEGSRVTMLVDYLIFQQLENIISAARNETAYMTLRNGLLLVVLALSISLVGATTQEAKCAQSGRLGNPENHVTNVYACQIDSGKHK